MSSTLDFTPNIVLSHKFSVYLDLADPRVGGHGLPPPPYLLQPKVPAISARSVWIARSYPISSPRITLRISAPSHHLDFLRGGHGFIRLGFQPNPFFLTIYLQTRNHIFDQKVSTQSGDIRTFPPPLVSDWSETMGEKVLTSAKIEDLGQMVENKGGKRFEGGGKVRISPDCQL